MWVILLWLNLMSEIERVIALVESFDQADTALLEMKFSFKQEELCRAFYSRALECFSASDVILPKPVAGDYICGAREVVKLDVEIMRALCHSYREIAYQYQGEPMKWAIKIRR